MAKLVYVGRNDGNKGGLSSKAYAIRRLERKVFAQSAPWSQWAVVAEDCIGSAAVRAKRHGHFRQSRRPQPL